MTYHDGPWTGHTDELERRRKERTVASHVPVVREPVARIPDASEEVWLTPKRKSTNT